MSDKLAGAGLARRMVVGMGWTISFRMTIRVLGVVSTVILARLLVPDDFGLIALAMLVRAAIEMLSTLNFEIWLIRHPDPQREHYDTVWTLSIIRGAVGCVALVLLANPAAVFFAEPRLAEVIPILGLASFAAGFRNVGVVDFQKHLEFDKDFYLLFWAKIGAVVISVGLAWWLRDYRAMVAGIVAAPIITLLVSFWMHAYRPRLSFVCWREAFHFSKWLFVGDVLQFFYSRADNFIIGKLGSTGVLGIYTIAHEIASLASTELVMPIRRVLIPGYAKMQNDLPALRQGFIDGFAIILLFGLPVAAGLGLVADPLVRMALGDKWLASIPILQILVLYGMTSVASANLGPLLIALGNTAAIAGLQVLGFVILVPGFTWGFKHFGAQGGAWAVGIADAVALLVGLALSLISVRVKLRELFAVTWRVMVATVMMAALVIKLQMLLGEAAVGAPVVLLASVVTGLIAYGGTTLVLWFGGGRPAGPERLILKFVNEQLGRSENA